MSKSKLKTILIVALLIIFIITPFIHAHDEDAVTTSEDTVTTSEDAELINETTTEIDENITNSDVYLAGEDIKIENPVVGNAFIVANNVTISAPIGGDAFIMAQNITIDGNGYVYSNLFACSDNLVINGIVYDLYAACNNITIAENGYVYRDLRSCSSNIDIFGTVGRNAYVACDKISLSSENVTSGYNTENLGNLRGTLYGNLEYISSSEISIPDGSVAGEVKFTQMSNNTNTSEKITDIILTAIEAIIFTIVVWLIINWLSPKYAENSKKLLTSKIGTVIGFGLLALIVLPIISLVLLFIPVTIGLSFLLLGIYVILLALTTSIFTITISNLIADKLNIDNKWLHLALVAVGALIIYLLKLIPYAGGIVSLICIILGLGILVKGFLPNKKSEEI